MNQEEILKYINSPGHLAKANIESVMELVREYPYFQTAHIILLKAAKIQNDESFQLQLQKSSVHISDRDLLFKFLNQKVELVENIVEVVSTEKTDEPILVDSKLLKNRNVKRKINNSFEGMGENISETLSSQIEFSLVKEKDKLEYPSEIYFVEEERSGKNNILTIDAEPEESNKVVKRKDILQIEEEDVEEVVSGDEVKQDEPFELLEIENGQEKDKEEKPKRKEYFDITEYSNSHHEHLEDDLITKFIKENPRIERNDTNEENLNLAEYSVKDDSNLLSETLIKVYIKQGLFDKAIQSYEKLSLKYPEKNAYFASQIKILEEKINKQ